MAGTTRKKMRFGAFEADPASGELRRNGARIKLQDQPFCILLHLLERPGEVVTREELREKIWPDGTFVEFEHSLNTSISKLRRALNDSASQPRYIETIPRRGYRFIGQLDVPPSARSSRTRRYVAATVVGLALTVTAVMALVHSGGGTPGEPWRVSPLTSYPGSERDPSFSPDGRQVAFSWDGPDQNNRDIYVKLIGPGEPIRMTTDPAPDSDPAFSPDGRQIAFVRTLPGQYGRGEIWLVPALGGRERKLGKTSIFDGFGTCLSWTPDGRSLLTLDYEAYGGPVRFYLLSVDSGERRQLGIPPTGRRSDYFPVLSPNGRSLAFSRDFNIWVQGLPEDNAPAVEPTQLTFDSRSLEGASAWTPDGKEILFGRWRGASGSFWRVSAAGGSEPQPIPLPGLRNGDLAISADGRRLAYTRRSEDRDIFRIEVPPAGGKPPSPRKLIDSTFGDAAGDYSPDGNRIVFGSSRSGNQEIWVANSDGSEPTQLTHFGGTAVGSPKWSPDGRLIAFDSLAAGHGDVFLINTEGGEPWRFSNHPAYDAVPAWSRDGGSIYFYSNRSAQIQIYKQPVGGGEAVQVTKNGGRQAMESVDGRYLYFVKAGAGESGFWRMPVTGGEEVPLFDYSPFLDYDVGAAGVYYSRDRKLLFYAFNTGETRTVLAAERTVTRLCLSSDGRLLLYTQAERIDSDLMLVEGFE